MFLVASSASMHLNDQLYTRESEIEKLNNFTPKRINNETDLVQSNNSKLMK